MATSKYDNLENKISGLTDTYFVARDTDYPASDMERNWSSTLGGINFQGREGFKTIEETEGAEGEYRYHPAHEAFCVVDYEGLGAFQLDAEDVEEAMEEAMDMEEFLAVTTGSGDGCFFAEDVVSFHKVREGRYIFELTY